MGRPGTVASVSLLRIRGSSPEGVEDTCLAENHHTATVNRVLAAKQPDEIVVALSLGGCRSAADRIEDLYAMTKDGDPDEPSIVLASLRELALFLLRQRPPMDPEIAVSPDGLLLAEWTSAERGVLAMKFLPTGRTQFAGVSPSAGTGPRCRVRGELPKDLALDAVQAFLPSP